MLTPMMKNNIYDALINCNFPTYSDRAEALRRYHDELISDHIVTFQEVLSDMYDVMPFGVYLEFIECFTHRYRRFVDYKIRGE